MADRISVGLVGAGYWGQKLLPKFLADSSAHARAVCDVHAGNRSAVRQRFPDVAVIDDYEILLRDEQLRAVVIATPPASHYALARRALLAGKHVWIEKPLALDVEEGRELVGLAQEKRLTLFVDHTFLYDPAVRKIRELIIGGECGKVRHLFLQRLNLGRIKRDSNVWWNSAPHDVSMILYLLGGRPERIALHGYRYLQPGVEDLNMAVVEMADGASAFIYHNWLYPENTAKLTVVGDRRLLTYEGKFDKRCVTVYEYSIDRSDEGRVPGEELSTTIPSKLLAEHRLDGLYDAEPLALAVGDFLGSIQGRRAPISDGQFSLEVLAVLQAGDRSLRGDGAKVAVRY
jgi:UDP-2-acetamido-3-amino-2,3-dideoxy-glucuronate N-acetyltransferase